MKPNIHAALYSAFIVGMMALMACSGGSGGGVNSAPAVDSPENSPPEIGTVTGAQGPTAAPPTTGTTQTETTVPGSTLDTTGSNKQSEQGTTTTTQDSTTTSPETKPIKNQDGVLIKGTWKQQSSLQPPRRSWIDKIGEFFIGTAYAENLGLKTHFRDIVPSYSSLTILTDVPEDDGSVQVITAYNGSPMSGWKKTTLSLDGYDDRYEYHRARLVPDPYYNSYFSNSTYLAWMGPDAMAPLHLARLDNKYGNFKIDLPTLSSYVSSAISNTSQLEDVAQSPAYSMVAVAISLNNNAGSGCGVTQCEPTVIGIYHAMTNA